MRQQIIVRKTLKKLLLFSIIVSSILYSCKKMDLNPSPPNEGNYTQTFFTTKTPVSPQIAGIIELLKKQNDRENFVNKLPTNYGAPVWNKLIFPKQQNTQSFGEDDSLQTDNIIIPLTSNGYSLSMVITGEKITDSSYLLRWYTAEDLYDVCYAPNKNISHAESLLALFMYIESSIYDRTDFYNIPKDLFTGIAGVSQTDSTKHIQLKHKDISISTNQQTQGFVAWACWYIPSGVCNCNGPCDWRNPCPTMYCTATYCVAIEEDPCPSCGGGGGGTGGGGGGTGGGGTGGGGTGGGGGGGGGGTGGGGGGGNPPNCGQVFYLVDPCGPPPPPLTRCQKVYQACQAATDLFRRTEMQSRKNEMTATFLPNREKAFWFGKANLNDPNYTTTNIILGDTGTSITLTPFPPSSLGQLAVTNGAAHAHTTEGFPAPSAGDMYNYAWINPQNPNFQFYLFSPGANDYAFIISDTVFLRNFSLNWPAATYFDTTTGDWKRGTEIFEKSDDIFTYFKNNGKSEDEAFELSQAFIAYQYQTGICIAKMDAQGNFNPIFVKEMPDPANPSKKIYQQTTVCNLDTLIIE